MERHMNQIRYGQIHPGRFFYNFDTFNDYIKSVSHIQFHIFKDQNDCFLDKYAIKAKGGVKESSNSNKKRKESSVC